MKHEKWQSVFFSVLLLNNETNSFNTIMQPIIADYAWKK